eukprot:403358586
MGNSIIPKQLGPIIEIVYILTQTPQINKITMKVIESRDENASPVDLDKLKQCRFIKELSITFKYDSMNNLKGKLNKNNLRKAFEIIYNLQIIRLTKLSYFLKKLVRVINARVIPTNMGDNRRMKVLNPMFLIAQLESYPKFLKFSSYGGQLSSIQKEFSIRVDENRKSNFSEPTTSKQKQYKFAGTLI